MLLFRSLISALPSLLCRSSQLVEQFLSKQLRDHQRQGVQFLYDTVMGLSSKGYEGCILADEVRHEVPNETLLHKREVRTAHTHLCCGCRSCFVSLLARWAWARLCRRSLCSTPCST